MNERDSLIAQSAIVLNELLKDAGVQQKVVIVTNSDAVIGVMVRDMTPFVTERVYLEPQVSKLELDEQQRHLDEAAVCPFTWAGRHCRITGPHKQHAVRRLDGTGDEVWEV